MEPIFSAVTNDTYHLYTLLRCIGFAEKARIQITPDGIRFSVEESRVMQGLVFLDRTLFTTYTFNSTPQDRNSHALDDEEPAGDVYPQFLISLTALLETLQIFGIGDASQASFPSNGSIQNTPAGAFTSPALLLGRTCALRYSSIGSPLCITLSESGITTTCELTTYESDDPSFGSEAGEVDIPLQRDAIIMKIIMRSAWLYNAINELDATNPTVLTISASSKNAPFLTLSGSGGAFSESSVKFSTDKENVGSEVNYKTLEDNEPPKRGKIAPAVTETFQVNPPSSMGSTVKENYRFALVRKASRAMAAASKVSIRGDIQGVLSLQFMIELGGGSNEGDAGLTRGGNARHQDEDQEDGDDVNSEGW
ncbi:DNA repair protein Rad1, putative [Talaromyces stipitatus ATCC 10500]|uniref:DNA repair protein Rad1, putative n=1 Tax=Talaromyces stipitatus (strain ATCC 10500 / CBS 375.48 / QM 6759 / NRRL 1006) TaxID=441959 RepID=B8LXJ7_TALSN|nr:DNA repair protein Rad1, putative [Talaromyces stipitatus ATCC 10500]EED24498.1 DNA repair protein Rad1, putative [Talaromyces stipitatus ATCC 10500]